MLGRLVSFVKRQQRDDDFQEELNAHLQLATEEYRRRGMREDEARRRALIDFGGVEAAKEVHRHARGMAGVESVLNDLRYAFRQLCQSPVFAATAVLSLALGIGGTTGIFSLIYSVLLHPYAYAGADRMVQVSTENESGNLRLVSLGGSQVQVMRKAKFVDDAIAWQNWALNTTGGDLPEDVKAVFITPNASTYFGLPPLLGRGLMPTDVSQAVVVLTQSFWQRHFGGRTDIIGKQLQLAHKDYRIVGVLASRFTWNGGDVYLPLKMTYASDQLYGVGIKLKPGVGLRAANAEFDALLHQFAKETPAYFPHRFRAHMERLNAMYANAFGGSLYLLLGAVTFLLLIGCANVSILLLSRGMLRRHELAIRAAVGASRSRILRQLLTESFLLSLTGAVLGLAIAYGILPVSGKWVPLYFPCIATEPSGLGG
jgi:predicted permease